MAIVALAATVVIAVSSAAAPSPELVQVLEDACTQGVRPRRCVTQADAPPDVVVEWTSARVARVEVRGSAGTTRVLA
ncbi:MAG TPA: hypothetical protein VHU80_14600, partial [Polyangiaceae bacterium]|nr:hypothetical protein [Polyangiaceae bacterium]